MNTSNNKSNINPMSLKSALFYFFIPTLLITINMYIIMSFLDSQGITPFINWLVVYTSIPMLLLITASIIMYKKEGNAMTWTSFSTRFRLKKLNKQDWIWTIVLFFFMLLSAVIMSVTSPIIASIFPPPQHWPDELNPLLNSPSAQNVIPTHLMGQPLKGNWTLLIIMIASLIIATLGEEFWWRGYILPRQELEHGKNTWIIHGFLWAGFHLFTPWNLIAILPGTLALSFVAQKRKNTSPAILAHGMANGFLVILIILVGI